MSADPQAPVKPATVLDCLRVLDARLAAAVDTAVTSFGEHDPFRGLHIGPTDVAGLFDREPGSSPLGYHELPAPDTGPFTWLAHTYGLSDFELNVVLIALAPEVDSRYERVYGFLQDDVTRRRPTVELTLNLLCQNTFDKITRRARFVPAAPLPANRIIALEPDPAQHEPPLIARYVTLDAQIVDVLLGVSALDRRLASWCRLTTPAGGVAELGWGAEPAARIASLLAGGHRRLYLQGPPGSGRLRVAEAVAADFGMPLLAADLAGAPRAGFADAVRCLTREAALFQAILYLGGIDQLGADQRRFVHTALSELDSSVLLAGDRPWTPDPGLPLGVLVVRFDIPDAEDRLACWREALAAAPVDGADLRIVAERFRLTPGHIADAAATARDHTLPELCAAAREQTGHELAGLAEPVRPRATWHDLVLPEDGIAALREICGRVVGRERVLHRWGFDEKLSRGTGITALFTGPPGTGKTMAAEVVAAELGLDLYRIDLAGVVSKYIGETEKNIERIFDAARRSNAILLFDEADALLSKRSEVHDAHDRYANIEVAYLLQQMESYDGLALLSTNLRHNLDDAFARRLAFTVHFPFPDEANRALIWRGIWPARTPLAGDVDLDLLASRFKLSGGNIKNIALAAAFLAEDGPVCMAHLLHAVAREYHKLGKTLTEAELAPSGSRDG